jgi:hypothetical protein
MSHFGLTEDGLQFVESQNGEMKITPYKWANSSSLSDAYFRRFKNINGTSTLAEMALRRIIRLRHLLNAEVLKEVPWNPMGRKLWDEIGVKCVPFFVRQYVLTVNKEGNDCHSLEGFCAGLWIT